MTKCQLIIDPPQRGSWNMAVDEWLLERAYEQNLLTLRFYQWSEPTLSLGYFQSHADRALHEPSRQLPMVRRASGGGALVHDRELTYSLAVPAGHPLARDTQSLYDAAHITLVDSLNAKLFGSSVQDKTGELYRCPQNVPGPQGEPFLCFLRRTKGDVVFAKSSQTCDKLSPDTHKICGSAQRKHRGAVLQHGGVLLSQSPHAPELPGLLQLGATPPRDTKTESRGITENCLREWWIESFTQRLGLELQVAEPFSSTTQAAIAELEMAKFAENSWTLRR